MISLILAVPLLFPITLAHYIPPDATPHNTTYLLKRGASSYPAQDVPGPTPKAAWIATYNAAKAAGKIPNYPVSVLTAAGLTNYPTGTNTGPTGLCSWTVSHCFGTADVVDAPTSYFGVAFDDGPQLASPPLYNFLKSKNQQATHFMIGSRIIDNPAIFQQAVANGDHIAVHTWAHPHMTGLTDMQVLGELGWTAQLIFDQSGLVPAFWRPPYGDVDNRVRAIAKEVFGMSTVAWNKDTSDWCLVDQSSPNVCGANGPQNDAGLDAEIQGFLKGSKTPGLIILEHELSSHTVGGFIRNYPLMLSLGWIPRAIPQIWGVGWYLNSVNTTSGVYGNVTIGSGGEYRGPPSATTTAVIPTTTVAPQTIGPIFSTPSGLGSLVPASTATIVVVTPTPSSAGSKLGLTSVWLSLMGLVVGGIIV